MRARDDPSPVFEATEHDFDEVATFVFSLVVFDWFSAESPSRDARSDPFFLQAISEPVSIIIPVRQCPLRHRQAVQQNRGPGVITELSCYHEKLSGRLKTTCIMIQNLNSHIMRRAN